MGTVLGIPTLGIPTFALIPAALILLAIAVVRRRRIARYISVPVVFTRGHVALGGMLLGLLFGTVVYVSHLNRESLQRERAERTGAEFRRVEAEILTRNEIREIAMRQAKLEAPSRGELARRSRAALAACGRSSTCRTSFTRVVNRVLRIEGGKLVPIPPQRGDVGSPPAEGGSPRLPPKSSPGPAGRDGAAGPAGPAGRDGKPGRSVDSGILDGLDNRLHDVEAGLASVLNRLVGLDKLLALVCKALPVCR